MAKIDQRHIALGIAKRISGADDRGQEIEQTLERLKEERIATANHEVQRILENARQQAAQLLAQAENTAQAILQEADAQRDATHQQAYDAGEAAGFEKGLADGHRQAREETCQLLDSARTLLQGAYQAQNTVLNGFNTQACRILQAVGQRVLGDELTTRPEQLAALVQHAIDGLDSTGQVRVVMNRDALRDLRTHGPEVLSALERLERLILEGDPLLDRQEILAISDEGSFDLSPQTQVTRCVEALAPALSLEVPNSDV